MAHNQRPPRRRTHTQHNTGHIGPGVCIHRARHPPTHLSPCACCIGVADAKNAASCCCCVCDMATVVLEYQTRVWFANAAQCSHAPVASVRCPTPKVSRLVGHGNCYCSAHRRARRLSSDTRKFIQLGAPKLNKFNWIRPIPHGEIPARMNTFSVNPDGPTGRTPPCASLFLALFAPGPVYARVQGACPVCAPQRAPHLAPGPA